MARCTALAMILAGPACTESAVKPIAVEVTRGDLVARQSFHGELAPKKTTPVNVPKVPRVDVLTLKTILPDGATVKAGDVVATFDTTELEENLRTAKTDLEIAEAERSKTEHALATERIGLELELKRRQMAVEEAKLRLVEGVNLISELDRKKAEVNLKSAEVELKLAASALEAFAGKRRTSLEVQDVKVRNAKSVVDETSSALERLSIKAPEDGVVFRPYVSLNFSRAKAEPGRVCRPGDKLLELPDLRQFEVTLYVRPRDANRITVSDGAQVYLAADPSRPLKAKVAKKDGFATTRNERYGTKSAEGNLKEIAVTLELLEDREGLRPGGSVRAEVESILKKDVVQAPLFALETTGQRAIATLSAGERREVDLGATTSTHGEVLNGLQAGDLLLPPVERKPEPPRTSNNDAQPSSEGRPRRH
jgi:multidrug efflux pump subunit AcrA (membrane-fusion protein)